MTGIFNALYNIHPWAPTIWLSLFTIGAGAFTLYVAFNQNIGLRGIYKRARSGSTLASAVLISYAVAVGLTLVVLCVAFASMLR